MRYFIKFSYDGSAFNGFQKQVGLKTIQGVIESALTSLNNSSVNIHASGRTDKGVHAKEQCAHFDMDRDFECYNLKKYLNNSFYGEIYVFSVEKVNDDFHARYNVKSKTYSYYINMGEYNPIMRNYIYQYCKSLNVNLMKEAVLCLKGEHDFRSFCTDEKNKSNCVRTIFSIDFSVDKEILVIRFTGSGFLRKMIRNIVACLLEIGSLKKDVSFMKNVLNNNQRTGNLKGVLGCGLYLEKVNYD